MSFGLYPDQILCLKLSLHGNALQKACIRAHHRYTGQLEEKGSLVAHLLENASGKSMRCRAEGHSICIPCRSLGILWMGSAQQLAVVFFSQVSQPPRKAHNISVCCHTMVQGSNQWL